MTARQGPLTWNVAIVDKAGNPTPEFMRKWLEQNTINGTIPTTEAAMSALLDLFGKTRGAILERGVSAWGEIVPVADGRVLRDKGVGADPIWDTISNVLDTAISSTRGSIIYRGAGGWVALAPGVNGQALVTQGAGLDPHWASSSGALSAPVVTGGLPGPIAVATPDGQFVVISL